MNSINNTQHNRIGRLNLIDTFRGLAIISMTGYHACWFIMYLGLGILPEMMFSSTFNIWERSICCTFIALSGFSFSLGKRHMRNALLILGLGVFITILSLLFAYDVRDIFGVLWLLGTSSLITMLIDKLIMKKGKIGRLPACICLAISLLIFVMLYNINSMVIFIPFIGKILLPEFLYSKGYVMTFIGFQDLDFYSVDYFSLLPWFFLYISGYFLHKITDGSVFEKKILTKGIPGLNWMGRHSLFLYLVHPVVLFIVLYAIKMLLY